MITQSIANLIFEAGIVKKLKRVGFQVLDNGEEPLGEHIFTTAVIAFFLAKEMKANMEKVLTMSIFHDFHEARTGDVHKLQSLYVTRDQDKANKDIFGDVDEELLATLSEYEEKKSPEAQIVYEANIIALLLALKPIAERGDANASEWLEWNARRLHLPLAVELANGILSGNSQDWWKKERDRLHDEYKK